MKTITPQTLVALAARKKVRVIGAKRKGQLRLAHTLGGRIRKRAEQVLAAETGGRRSKRGGGCTSDVELHGGQKAAVEVRLAGSLFVCQRKQIRWASSG